MGLLGNLIKLPLAVVEDVVKLDLSGKKGKKKLKKLLKDL